MTCPAVLYIETRLHGHSSDGTKHASCMQTHDAKWSRGVVIHCVHCRSKYCIAS